MIDEKIFTFHVAKEMIGYVEESGPTIANLQVSEYSNDEKRSRK